MHADIGDELVIGGHRVGQKTRRGKIVEVRGAEGAPPYLVNWTDDGRQTLLFPGPDCLVEHGSTPTSGAEVS